MHNLKGLKYDSWQEQESLIIHNNDAMICFYCTIRFDATLHTNESHKKYKRNSDMQLHGRFNTSKQSLLESSDMDAWRGFNRMLQLCFTVKLNKCFEDNKKWLNFILGWIVSLRWFLLVLSTTGTRVWIKFLWHSSCQHWLSLVGETKTWRLLQLHSLSKHFVPLVLILGWTGHFCDVYWLWKLI